MKYQLSDLATRGATQENLERLRCVIDYINPNWETGPWIAGGCIRRLAMGQDPLGSDVDIFFASETQKNEFLGLMERNATVLYTNDTNTTLSVMIPDLNELITLQAVHVDYFSSAEEVIDSFDYTICQFVTDGTKVEVGDFTLWDVGRKRLVLHRTTYAVATMRRMIKYTKQGFYACPGMMNDLLTRVADDPTLINEELAYID